MSWLSGEDSELFGLKQSVFQFASRLQLRTECCIETSVLSGASALETMLGISKDRLG